MRIHALFAAVAVAGSLAGAAHAQDGQYQAALTRIVNDAREGRCPADLMAPGLLDLCRQQADGMRAAFADLGEVQSITFRSAEEDEGVRVERYEVRWTGGRTQQWTIGALQDGKFQLVAGG